MSNNTILWVIVGAVALWLLTRPKSSQLADWGITSDGTMVRTRSMADRGLGTAPSAADIQDAYNAASAEAAARAAAAANAAHGTIGGV